VLTPNRLLAIFLFLLLPAAALADSFDARVIGITDGRTLTVLKDGQPLKLYLNGLSVPEGKQPFGDKSRQALSGLVYDKTVTVHAAGHDRNRQILADVVVGGVSVNKQMIQSGMAYHDRLSSTDTALANAEIAAQKSRVGMWSQPDAAVPWEYRQEQSRSSTIIGGSGGQIGPGAVTISGGGAAVGVSAGSQSGSSTYTTRVIPPSGAAAGGQTTIQTYDITPPSWPTTGRRSTLKQK
jgi:micrococcal nuclease